MVHFCAFNKNQIKVGTWALKHKLGPFSKLFFVLHSNVQPHLKLATQVLNVSLHLIGASALWLLKVLIPLDVLPF